MTMHRPALVDTKEGLKTLLRLIEEVTSNYPVVFPIHPRTVYSMKIHGIYGQITKNEKLIVTEPLDYFSFQNLIFNSKFVITDSGGIQEETTFRQIPCITLRNNTERPVTVTMGTNSLVKLDLDKLKDKISNIDKIKGDIPTLWDGKATSRIVEVLNSVL